jgi:hypothetical protein
MKDVENISREQLETLESQGWVVSANRGLWIEGGWLCRIHRGTESRTVLVSGLPE